MKVQLFLDNKNPAWAIPRELRRSRRIVPLFKEYIVIPKQAKRPRIGRTIASNEAIVLGRRSHPCNVYTWKRPGRPPVRFVGPQSDDPHQRLFLPEPLVKFLAAQNKRIGLNQKAQAKAECTLTTFFERAFEDGYQILREFDHAVSSLPSPDEFRLMKSLFRNRLKGAVGVGRRLMSVRDLVRYTAGGTLDVIVPGLLAKPGVTNRSRTFGQNALACLASAMPEADRTRPLSRSLLTAAKHHSQDVTIEGKAKTQATLDAVPHFEPVVRLEGRSAVEAWMTVGLLRGTSWRKSTSNPGPSSPNARLETILAH